MMKKVYENVILIPKMLMKLLVMMIRNYLIDEMKIFLNDYL